MSPTKLILLFCFLITGYVLPASLPDNSGSSSSSEECNTPTQHTSPCRNLCINTRLSSINPLSNGCTEVILEVFCDPTCFPGSGSGSGSSDDGSGSNSGSRSNSGSGSGSHSGSSGSAEPVHYNFIDISLPCGNLGPYSNSEGFDMEVIAVDSVSGISGLRVNGLPNCKSRRGSGSSFGSGSGSSDDGSGSSSGSNSNSCSGGSLTSFTITYQLCPDTTRCWSGDICAPLVAYGSGPCVQYEIVDEGNQSNTAAAKPESSGLENFKTLPEAFAFPNPFRESISFEIDLPDEAAVSIDILDMNGKLVRTFPSTERAKGTHRLIWNGTDQRDHPQSDGIYFARIMMGDHVQVIKVVLQR